MCKTNKSKLCVELLTSPVGEYKCASGYMVVWKTLHDSVQAAAWQCASSSMVMCKWLNGSVQVVVCQCASGFIVVCKRLPVRSKDELWGGVCKRLCGGGPCDFSVTPVPIGLGFRFGTALGFGLGIQGTGLGTRAWRYLMSLQAHFFQFLATMLGCY